jgi:hypothetical protein
VNCDSSQKDKVHENVSNERIKRAHFTYLIKAQDFSEARLTASQRLNCFETYTRFRDFKDSSGSRPGRTRSPSQAISWLLMPPRARQALVPPESEAMLLADRGYHADWILINLSTHSEYRRSGSEASAM